MALREELRTSGDWLFRRRSHLPLLLFLALIPVMAQSHMAAYGRQAELSWEGLCLLIALLGEGIRIATVGFVPAGTSGGNVARQRADRLNTTGMYSLVRHPLYLGNFLMWMGVAMTPQNGWFVLVVALGFWLYYERIMFAEEEFLRERHGDEYLEWAGSTPAFLPRLRNWRAPELSFSLKFVLRREHSSVMSLITSFAVLDLLDHFAITGALDMDPVWMSIFVAGMVGSLVLVMLKRLRKLRVEGR
jgi:protein-S-isoprenylcysteine O-methyltransferase Ste14